MKKMQKAGINFRFIKAVFLLGIIVLSGSIDAETYYVSLSGNNSNPGTKEKPWATPGFASRRLKPGDTLIILSGTYYLSRYDEDIITPRSGNPKAWITIKGPDNESRPVLAGRNNLAYVIRLSNVSHVKIENLEITSEKGAILREGITAIDRPVSHIVFNNLYIHHLNEFGMNLKDVKHVLVFNSKIDYCGFGSIGGPKAQSGGWQHVVIKDCSLSYSGHFYRGGKNPYDRPDGFGIEPSNGPIEIVNSIAEHNRGDGLDSKAKNTYIHECEVANNRCDGVKLWGSGSRIENCLIYGRGDGDTHATPWAAIVIDSEKHARFEIVNTTVDDHLGKNYIMYVQYDTPNIP
ncbi:MAG: right-handed parallel beta-helix repeat-containing protein, partial [Candidatus Aminicenantes bacterium]|nr:right-handed parallel beta-helix repeat-containing protein [Candidatus Aminicenantes bacterium]